MSEDAGHEVGDGAGFSGRGSRVPDTAMLTSFRLVDSLLPVGTDSVSYGLEAFVAAGRVTDGDDLAEILTAYLRRQLGAGDLIALRTAHAATGDDIERVCRADRRLHAATLQSEFRKSATRTGKRLLTLQRDLRDDRFIQKYAGMVADGTVPGGYPVVLGVVTARAGVDERLACLIACQEFATAFVSAAQRLLQLGHTEIQRVLQECQPAMSAAVEDSTGRSLEEMTPFAPLVDIHSATHERADRRLFLS